MQYLMESSGNVMSFNYGLDDTNYHHLTSQDYAICFRRAHKHCKIGYIPSENGESFYLSFTPSTPTIKSRVGETGCPADFLTIPRGTNSLYGDSVCTNPTPTTASNFGRFCGRRLNCATDSAANSAVYSD